MSTPVQNKTIEKGETVAAVNSGSGSEDLGELRHVMDHIPLRVYLAALLGMVERFTFYGFTAPLQNYMQHSGGNGSMPGALNLGQSKATLISYTFLAFTYVTPVPAAVIADCWLGRFKTIIMSVCIYSAGILLIFVTSLPISLDHGAGTGGLIAGLVLISFGLGGVKATVAPFIIDQYIETAPRIFITKQGERVVTDRTVTMQYLYNLYYWLINIASLSMLATTYLERFCGFWAAFLLPSCMFWTIGLVLFMSRHKFVKQDPQGNILPMTFRILVHAARNGFNLNSAKPENVPSTSLTQVTWTSAFVEELKRGLIATKMMAAFCIVWLCMGQVSNNLVSQAGQMVTNGFPNDAIPALNPIACIVLGPLIQKLLYPYLSNRKIPFRPIARVTSGFILITLSMSYAAILQSLIYRSAPCYNHPLSCPASRNGTIPNKINVWLQTPIYVLLAAGEIFCVVTGMEYAYAKAPKAMRSVVQAIGVLTAGLGAVIGVGMSQLAVNPKLVSMYAVLAGAMGGTSVVFWVLFRKYDEVDEELNGIGLHEGGGSEENVQAGAMTKGSV